MLEEYGYRVVMENDPRTALQRLNEGAQVDLLDKPYGRRKLVRRVRLVLDGPNGVA